jgi:hypothetical protein
VLVRVVVEVAVGVVVPVEVVVVVLVEVMVLVDVDVGGVSGRPVSADVTGTSRRPASVDVTGVSGRPASVTAASVLSAASVFFPSPSPAQAASTKVIAQDASFALRFRKLPGNATSVRDWVIGVLPPG